VRAENQESGIVVIVCLEKGEKEGRIYIGSEMEYFATWDLELI